MVKTSEGNKAKIAILGWGSLLWEAGAEFSKNCEAWHYDGPILKIEFSRISESRLGALTLVIDEEYGTNTTVAWCLSKRTTIEEAAADLRCREGTTNKNICSLYLDASSVSNPKTSQISDWAKGKNLSGVVWTGLTSNFEKTTGKPFSNSEAINYIQQLPSEAKAKAAEYVWRAPSFVQTALRSELQREPWFTGVK